MSVKRGHTNKLRVEKDITLSIYDSEEQNGEKGVFLLPRKWRMVRTTTDVADWY
ncbi:MAG: hypothetical protein Q6352_015920 [Candidatus Freyrarchaeum guaymaensis]|nr:hypothetical protein [Candidatus Sigynarchaeota archaeon]